MASELHSSNDAYRERHHDQHPPIYNSECGEVAPEQSKGAQLTH